MFWVVFAVIAAIFEAVYYTLLKHPGDEVEPQVLASGIFLTAAAALLATSATRGFPEPGPAFLPAALIAMGANAVAAALYLRVLRRADLSLAIPMLSFTPVFLIATSYAVLGEAPSAVGAAGILCIIIGSYILNSTPQSLREPLEPFRRVLHAEDIRPMFAVALLFSISLSYDKVVLMNSDPYFGMGIVFLMAGSVFLAAALIRGPKAAKTLKQHYPLFLAGGMALALSTAGTNMAFSLQITSYVIAIKRLSILFTVAYGILILGEGYPHTRLLGAATMVAGAIAVAL